MLKSAFALLIATALLSAAALAESGRPHLSADPRVNGARMLIEDGRFGEALAILRPLAPNHPDRTDVLFLVGLAAINASQRAGIGDAERDGLLDEAVAALHTILVDRPGLVRVRLELARAFFLKGQDELARTHFGRVLAGKPPPAVAANVHRFLNAIRARRRWSGRFGFALAPDSNVGAASDEDIFYFRGLPLTRSEDSKPTSGVGVIVWGGGEFQHPLGERVRLRIGADIARREYGNRSFDQTVASGYAGPRWLANPAFELSVLGSARRHFAAGRARSRELGVRIETEHRFSPRLRARSRGSRHRRKFARSPWLDGPHSALSLSGIWQMTPAAQVDAAFEYARERPQSLNWRNSRRGAHLGASVALPAGFTVGAGAGMHWTKYEGRWGAFTPGGVSREDRTRTLRASLFNRAFTVHGFSPELVLVNEERESNAQLHGYRRNRVELRFVRQFQARGVRETGAMPERAADPALDHPGGASSLGRNPLRSMGHRRLSPGVTHLPSVKRIRKIFRQY